MILILYVISKYKIMTYINDIYSLFENVVAVAFQNTFQFEIHQNVVFFIFLKKLFLKSIYQNDPKHIKNLIFHKFF
jgi:hypothetical protein